MPFVCQRSGRFPHPDNCHRYYLCVWLPFGLYDVEQSCILGWAYNPLLQRCTADQAPCFPNQFTCTAPGRFPDPTANTRYFWCVWNVLGGYLQYNLDCPPGQTFDAYRRSCAAVRPGGRSIEGEEDEPVLNGEVSGESESEVVELPAEKVKFECSEEGTFPDPANCARYFICTLKKKDKYKKSKLKCPKGQLFDAALEFCTDEEGVICGGVREAD